MVLLYNALLAYLLKLLNDRESNGIEKMKYIGSLNFHLVLNSDLNK